MTAAPRITKIICPSCEGSGEGLLDYPCFWCKGTTRLPVADARRYADTTWTFAGGAYVIGDCSYDEMRKQEAKAERIYALTGAVPPWKQEGSQT